MGWSCDEFGNHFPCTCTSIIPHGKPPIILIPFLPIELGLLVHFHYVLSSLDRKESSSSSPKLKQLS